ncbi:LTA synthase family protein [Patescibacteria group bacterium]|nr:LTA synthase family protein [Patescibacteria group bacterium]
MNKLRFIHPFLFAIYPALFLYAYNISHFKENVLIIPLVISLIFAGTVFLISLLIIRKPEISAVISSFIILVFFSYSRLREPARNVFISSDKILFAAIILILVIIIFLSLRYKHYLKNINKALTVFSMILVIIALYNIASSEIKLGRIFLPGLGNETNQLQSSGLIQTPDIYYFVPDRYAGDKTLKDYGFDNSTFANFLKNNGFYIALDSTSNYPKTFLSLGSTLNMEYLDFLTQKTNGGATSDQSIVTPLVQNNKIIQFLKSKGYSYIHVGSGWDPTRSNPYADYNFVMNGGRYPFTNEFTSGFLHTTLASPILKKLYPDTTAVSQNPKNNDHRSRVLYEFSVFDQILEMDGPKFVFAHILLPHDPYVLDKDCEPLTEKTVKSRTGVENYLNQLQCTNQKIEEVIEKILANSKTKPIIIIQADEGPSPIVNKISSNVNWKDAGDASLNEKFPILNAYFLPDLKNNPLYPSITPVNSFRAIFNSYFGTDLPLLPDRNIIFEDNHNFYKFIDVTDRLKAE